MSTNLAEVLILFFALLGTSDSQVCQKSPECICNVEGDNVPIGEQTGNSETLAGAVGALGTLVVVGAGLLSWLACKKYACQTSSPYQREGSSLSQDSLIGNGSPANSGYQPTNIYRAGMQDELNHRTGVPGDSGPPSFYNKGQSDWK
ncbi:hypothetical protein ScPMuIL_014765 [Solemya velum]